jgi:two-component system NtrC family response regulator
MPDGSGLDILPAIRGTPSSPEVIIITGFADPDGAELAVKNGAWDYIEKPSSVQEIVLPLVRALQYREEKRAKKRHVVLKREGLLGGSSQMMACLEVLAQAAASDASVLITGETGTGKELFAQAIHANGPRAGNSFVVVDCAALPETLVESILFGHEKGAFTGADRAREGLIKQADGGTLFLDEVGELPLSMQRAFLRVLQEHRFRAVGGDREVVSDFRLIAATNRNIEGMLKQGQFREDLFFRIRSLLIELSPLRERPEDIREIALYHMAKECERLRIGTKGLCPDFLNALAAYPWPGNVRELVNAVETAIAAAQNETTLFLRHLPTHIRVHLARALVNKETGVEDSANKNAGPSKEFPSLQDFRKTAEQQYLRDLMSVTNGNIREACRISGLSRSRLYSLMKECGVSARR